MKKSQVTDSNINVVQKETEEIAMESNSEILENQEKLEQVNVVENQEGEEEKEMPFEMVKRIVPLANKGFELTMDCEELNPLFAGIYNSCNDELLPKVEKLTDFENLTDELKNAGDILAKIIGYADKGFTLTDVPDEQQPFSEVHLLFSEILMIADTEIRQYIPTPVNA